MTSSIVVAHAPRHRPEDLVVEHVASRVALVLSRGSFEVFVKARYAFTVPVGADPGVPARVPLQLLEDVGVVVPRDVESEPAVTSGGGATGARFDASQGVLVFAMPNAEGSPGEVREVHAELPRRTPRVLTVAATTLARDTELAPDLHRVHVDGSLGVIDFVYRGTKELEHPRGADVDSLVVHFADASWWDVSEPNGRWSRPRRDLPRGRFERVVTEADVAAGQEPEPLDEGELAMARYSTWGFELPPLPTMAVDRFARIQAELCEQRRERAEILESHGLTEYAFSVEESAFAHLSAEVPDAGDEDADGPPASPGFAERYGVALAREQARLEDPSEASRTVEDYARVVVALGSGDPRRAFSDNGIGMGAFMRLEARMSERARGDAAFEQALEEAIDAERKRVAARKRSAREEAT